METPLEMQAVVNERSNQSEPCVTQLRHRGNAQYPDNNIPKFKEKEKKRRRLHAQSNRSVIMRKHRLQNALHLPSLAAWILQVEGRPTSTPWGPQGSQDHLVGTIPQRQRR